jgi:hypothetical protein
MCLFHATYFSSSHLHRDRLEYQMAAVSELLVCACAGAAMPNIPQVIAKVAATTATVNGVFIEKGEDTMNLKGV